MKFDRSTVILMAGILLTGIAIGYIIFAPNNEISSVTKEMKITGNLTNMEVCTNNEFQVGTRYWEGMRKQEGNKMIVSGVFSVEISTAIKKDHKYNLAVTNDFNNGGNSYWTGSYGTDGDKLAITTNNPSQPMTISYEVRDGKPYGKVHITIA